MNPNEIPQKPKRQASHNLDESQSSSVSIKIFNKNDDNVVIRLYRSNTKTNRDRFKNSSGHQRQAAGRNERKDKRKATMLRNLYRNTFGPTLDETVLVGMETFQICQHNAHPNSQVSNGPNASSEDFRKDCNCIIPNELSWDCSTLLPTNNNEKHFESVYTNTSNCTLDKEKNLSPLVTNQYQYNPFSNNSQTCYPCDPSTEDTKPYDESNQVDDAFCFQNNISSDENLNTSYQEQTPEEFQKNKTFQKPQRKSSGYDAPSPRNSYSEEKSNQEAARLSTFTSRNSEISPSNCRKCANREPLSSAEEGQENPRRSIPDIAPNSSPPAKRCTFHESMPRSHNKQSINSETIEENPRRRSLQENPRRSSFQENPRRSSFQENPRKSSFQENPTRSSFQENPRKSSVDESEIENCRRSSVQRRSTSAGSTEEPPRRISNKIADYFRKNSRKSSADNSSSPIKSTGGSNDDLPRQSTISPDTNETCNQKGRRSSTPKRSSLPPEYFIEADDDLPQEENLRRSTTNGRESKGFLNKFKRKSCPKSPRSTKPNEIEGYIRTGSNEDIPHERRLSTDSYEVERQKCRRSTTPRRSSSPRKSFDDGVPEYSRNSIRKSTEIEGFIRTGSNEDMPRVSMASPDPYVSGHTGCRRSSTPVRSSSPRNLFAKELSDEDLTREEILRRSTVGAESRESKGVINNCRKSTSPRSSLPAKSMEIEGYIRTGSYDEIPRQSTISPETYEPEHCGRRRSSTPRRSSLPRKSFNEEISDDGPPQDENVRRSTIDSADLENQAQNRRSRRSSALRPTLTRKSFNNEILDDEPTQEENVRKSAYTPAERKSFTENLRNSTFESVPLRNSFDEEGPSPFEEDPMISTFSPEHQEYEEDFPPYSNQRKSRQLSNIEPDEFDTFEKSGLQSCQCQTGETSRNKTPQETRYAITRVTKYDDYTTYEILKSTRAKPKKIPAVLEKIFIEKDT